MATFDFKTATPVTSGLTDAYLYMGAASQASATPDIYTLLALKNYVLGGSSGITTSAITITQGTITADTPGISDTVTWNNAGVTFTGWKLNVTNTASNAASLLVDLQVGGTSQALVTRAGVLLCNGIGSQPLPIPSAGALPIYTSSIRCTYPGSTIYFQAGTDGTTTTVWLGNNNLAALVCNTANVLEQRNGTNAQRLNIYNTYTDASNNEYGGLNWNSNTLELFTASTGGGTRRSIRLAAGATADIFLDGSSIVTNADSYYAWTARVYMAAPASGIVTLMNGALNDFSRLQFGGTTSSFPALRRDGSGLTCVVADNSAAAQFNCSRLTTNETVGAVSIGSGPTISCGSGSPEGVITAPAGSLYLNTAGGADTALYTKNSGSGNTGWVAVNNV